MSGGMRMRLAWRLGRLMFVAALSAGSLSCVQIFEGSWVELFLQGAQVPSNTEASPGGGRPPSGTHYEIWVVSGNDAFHVHDFQIVPAFDSKFPCFIEDDESRFP